MIRDAEVIVVYGNPDGLEVVKGGNCVFRGRAVIAKTLDDRGYTQVRPPG